MRQYTKVLLMLSLLFVTYTPVAYSHCQVPCGIYDDNARVKSMLEDAATVRKAITSMTELADKADIQSRNQFVRWVMNKETHAQNIISTISDYFLTQRVKADQKDYTERLIKHHTVIVAAMKAKQNSDLKNVISLEKSLTELLPYYPEHEHEKTPLNK